MFAKMNVFHGFALVLLASSITSCCNTNLKDEQLLGLVWASQEAAQVADDAGIGNAQVYPNVVYEAYSGNRHALHQVLQLAPHADGAGYEFQSGILFVILKSVGDTKFADVLKEQDKQLISANIEMLRRSSEVAASKYPRTFDLSP